MNADYYSKCLTNIWLNKDEKALDLGCGPGALCYALAEKAHPDSEITGIDISDDQLNYAEKFSYEYPCSLEFGTSLWMHFPFPIVILIL